SNTTYPLTTVYPDIILVTNPNSSPNRIAIYSSYKSNPSRNYPLYISQVPLEIELLLLEKCRYLLPVFLYCSLGHTLEQTSSQNKDHTFLEPSTTVSTLPWLDNSLINAVNWLKENNPIYMNTLICFKSIHLPNHLYHSNSFI
ncbi:21214_t:CDS:2, partial [Racocetra persica]